ncbi:phosphate ABC transporter substrate-binding protein [Methanomicrobium antiquum]|uniref:Phosphate ABC transporter substrate-binding protein n=1 Tax=Methanomicrobium antiquum TaxID=487686 RepID=A0AAF0FNU9_9EURY|nr:phosphate ABC transporter substrate-binding protein [Methanomicrobium antiquum]WFN37698.1 phosphate ABC transporter substrate-binding protein [Methanomicrobium antiquum]
MNGLKLTGLKTAVIAAFVVCMVMVCGCLGSDSSSGNNPLSEKESIETLSVTGSTTVLPVGQAVAEEFMRINQNADIQLSGGGSSVGVQAVGEGTADIGMASRELKDSEKEKYQNLVQHVVAKDGIALIVSNENSISEITLDSVKKIYKGEITNWKELGGSDMAVVVVGRDSSSGTREFFAEKIMGDDDFVSTQLEKNSNGAVLQTIKQTPGGIGYISMGYLDENVKALKINENGAVIEPTTENVLNGRYPVARGLNMFTNGEPQGLAKEYLNFLLGESGQAIVVKEGYVSVI